MKIRDKILSFVLAAVMLVPTAAMAGSVEVYDVKNESVQSAINMLDDFGLISIYSDNSFRGFEKVTRRDMAILVSEMFGNAIDYSSSYKDVSEDDDGFGAIGYVTAKGIMVGRGGGKFKPDDFITGSEAVKVVVSALGYDISAQQKGGFPNGYLSVASELKLPLDFDMDSEITKNDMVLLLYKAYEAPVCKMEYKDGKLSFSFDEDNTLLSVYHNIYKYKGIVTGNYLTELNKGHNSAIDKDKIMIDGTLYDSSLGDTAQDLLGYYVDYYLDESNHEEKVVSIVKSNKNREITVNAEDVSNESEKSKIIYQDANDKEKTLKVSYTADFILNREAAPEFSKAQLIPNEGQLKLVDNNDDGTYDVVFVEDYKTVVVERIDRVNEKVFNKYRNSEMAEIDLSDNTDIVEFEKNDAAAAFGDITAGAVLSVLKSENSILVKINTESISGTVTEMDEDYVTIDGNKIKISYALEKAWDDKDILKVNVGSECTIFTDSFTNAAYITFSSVKQYGFLRKRYIEDDVENYNEPVVAVRVFSINDEQWHDYYCRPKMKFNGEKPNDAQALLTLLDDKQVIRYKLNSKGEITELETAEIYDSDKQKNAADNDYFRKSDKESRAYRIQNTSWDSRWYMNGDTKILYVPTGDDYQDIEEYYKLETTSVFTADIYYSYQVYDYDDEKFAKLVCHLGSGNSGEDCSSSGLMLISEISGAVNDDDEVVKQVSGLLGGKTNKFYTTSRTNNILDGYSEGDVIQVNFDEDGKLSAIEETYKMSSGQETRQSAIGDFHAIRTIIKAKVTRVGERTISITTDGGDYTFKRGGNVAIYDSKSSKHVKEGTFDDISEGDFVVMRYRESSLHDTIVYK